MEDKRFHVSITNIENDLNALHCEIQDVPIKLFFHLGVLGTAEFDDSRQQIAIVPINYPYGYKFRAEKHSTCLTCINLDGISDCVLQRRIFGLCSMKSLSQLRYASK